MYFMDRDGFTLLVMGFTGEKALNFKIEFIEAFNIMENTLKSANLPNFQVPKTLDEDEVTMLNIGGQLGITNFVSNLVMQCPD